MLIAVIERHPGWGYTSEIKEDNQKAKIVLTVVQNTLTHARSSIKGVLGRSFGDPDPNEPENDRLRVGCADIVQLTRDSIRTLDTNRLVVNKTRANLAMCTRFAFLRQEYRKPENEKDFWKGVDNELAALRNKYKADPKSLNKYFTDVLTKDVKIYGDSPDSGEVVATEKHDQQREVEAFAERTESQLTNLGNEDGEDD
ncbi:hypothetical protein QCA50_014820 [Cerrena zonata]|uniref:Uncharacterized protein n=1 Tax=Cerrena zonata TaxID=2478898 RepID=A0AAW0FXA0_9APHY